ncbi:hypothetical protein BC679P4_00026 [Bacteroides phage BC679P4]|nr:hypothetical protein BC679P1_00026 [Bacteroides phage BC679P1]WAX05930.1 hypothetical protein BC679P4_00026 [Bacteroides phage BC679P4]
MADMEHLFREREMREMERATGRTAFTERFKTALYRAEQAQYNMRKKIDEAEAEETVIYRELASDGSKSKDFTICRKNAPDVQLTLTRTEMYALLGKIREALKS